MWQTDETEEMYTTLLEEIRSLSAQQKALENQVIDVSSEQQRQNTEAEAHHADTSLKDTISAGFGDLQASYVSLQGQMDELLSKQDAALASTEAALAAQQRSEQLVQQLAAQVCVTLPAPPFPCPLITPCDTSSWSSSNMEPTCFV